MAAKFDPMIRRSTIEHFVGKTVKIVKLNIVSKLLHYKYTINKINHFLLAFLINVAYLCRRLINISYKRKPLKI